METTLALAFGADEAHWIHLPLARGRAEWLRLVEPHARVVLAELYAYSTRGELAHPGEVPIGSPTTLPEILRLVDEELGMDAVLAELHVLLAEGTDGAAVGLAFHARRGVRLEGSSWRALAPCVGRSTGVSARRWQHVLEALDREAFGGQLLQVTPGDGTARVVVHADLRALEAGGSGEVHEIAA